MQTLNLWPLLYQHLIPLSFQVIFTPCCSSLFKFAFISAAPPNYFDCFFILYQKYFVTIMFEFWSPLKFASSQVMGRLFLIFLSCSLWDRRFTRCVSMLFTLVWVCACCSHHRCTAGCILFTLGVSMSAAGPALSAPRLKMGALLRVCVCVCGRQFFGTGGSSETIFKIDLTYFPQKIL